MKEGEIDRPHMIGQRKKNKAKVGEKRSGREEGTRPMGRVRRKVEMMAFGSHV